MVAPMSIYRSLERDWEQIRASTSAARRLAGRAAVEPALGGYPHPPGRGRRHRDTRSRLADPRAVARLVLSLIHI